MRTPAYRRNGAGRRAQAGAGMAIESEITLSAQERGKQVEYRIIAVNKAGEGQPSNTVMAVL